MKLYHGSNLVVNSPRILTNLRALDFGAGFYLTSSKEQARKLTDQYAFLTEKAIRFLTFERSEEE